jgi:hypothetical protein
MRVHALHRGIEAAAIFGLDGSLFCARIAW